MPSNYTGDAATATDTLSLMVDSDEPSAQLFRVPLERLLDNGAAQSAAHNRLTALRAVQLHVLSRAGDTIDAAADSLAAIHLGIVTLVIKANTNGCFLVSNGSDRYALTGTLSTITGAVKGVAAYGGAIVAFGVGGDAIDASSDFGQTWVAGANPGISGTRCRIVADPMNSKFILSSPGSASIRNSIDATSWTSHATGASGGVAGMSQTPFQTLVLSESANTLFHSTNGGDAWAAVTGFPANAGSFDESGCIIGDYDNSVIWHAARLSAGVSLQVSSGTIIGANATWTVRATITAASIGLSEFSARPRIFCCPDTGLLVVVGQGDTSTLAYAIASTDGGVTWGEAGIMYPGADYPVDAFAVAGGRLFASTDIQLLASAGIGG